MLLTSFKAAGTENRADLPPSSITVPTVKKSAVPVPVPMTPVSYPGLRANFVKSGESKSKGTAIARKKEPITSKSLKERMAAKRAKKLKNSKSKTTAKDLKARMEAKRAKQREKTAQKAVPSLPPKSSGAVNNLKKRMLAKMQRKKEARQHLTASPRQTAEGPQLGTPQAWSASSLPSPTGQRVVRSQGSSERVGMLDSSSSSVSSLGERIREDVQRQARGLREGIRSQVTRAVRHAWGVQLGGRPEPSRAVAVGRFSARGNEVNFLEKLKRMESTEKEVLRMESMSKQQMVNVANEISQISSMATEKASGSKVDKKIQERIEKVAKSIVKSKAFEKGFCALVSNEGIAEVIEAFQGLYESDQSLWRDITQLLKEYQNKRAEMLVIYIAVVKAVDIPEYQEPKVKEALLEDVKPSRIKKEKSSKKSGNKEITSSEKAQIVEAVEQKFASKVGGLAQKLKSGTIGEQEFRAEMLSIRKEILSEIASMIDQIKRS